MRVELLNGKDIDDRLKIVATAGKLSRRSGTVFDVLDSSNSYEKNLRVIKNIIDMGHKSIIEHDYLVFAISGVTPIMEQILIGSRLASFTVKSRREVDFSKSGYYVPSFDYLQNNNEITNRYNDHMQYLFSSYSDLLDMGISKEDARFVLPYSFYSDFIMGMDLRNLEKLIEYLTNGKVSNIDEAKILGNRLKEIVLEYAKYMEKEFDKHKKYDEDIYSFLDDKVDIEYDILDRPVLNYYSSDIDNTILTSIIMNRYQVTKDKALNILNKLSDEDKALMMSALINSKEQRELEQVTFGYQIPISLASLTHLTRHRMHSLVIPDFLPMWDLSKYKVPPKIASKCLDTYNKIYSNNIYVYNEFKQNGVKDKDLVYFYLSGNMCNVHTNINGRSLVWISRLRCCNKAQWEIRKTAYDMIKPVRELAPLYGKYLGSTCDVNNVCYEGKECCGKVYSLRGKKNI